MLELTRDVIWHSAFRGLVDVSGRVGSSGEALVQDLVGRGEFPQKLKPFRKCMHKISVSQKYQYAKVNVVITAVIILFMRLNHLRRHHYQ